MIPHERQRIILDHLEKYEVLTVEDAVQLLKASPATVRRDFNELARQHLAIRTHGGVGSARLSSGDMVPFWCKAEQYAKEKSAILKEATGYIKPNDIVMVDGGTTTYHLAEHLPSFPFRVISNSVRLAVAIDERRTSDVNAELFLTGGYIYPQSGLLIGPQAETAFSRYHANLALISVVGICADGLYNSNEFIVETQLAMMEKAERVVVLADHSKIGVRSMCHVCGLDKVHTLITDAHPSTVFALKQLEGEGLRVIAVDVSAVLKQNQIRRTEK